MSITIPKGYKASSLGPIPIDWEVKKVGSICDFIVPGRNKPKAFTGDIPWVTTPDIENNGTVLFSKQKLTITKEEAKRIGSKIVPKDSIIISCVGELGLVAIAGCNMVINQQLHAFIPQKNVDYKFLLYSLSIQKGYMDKIATKTAVPYMNKNNCNSIPIILPPLPEQRKIGAVLSAFDEAILISQNLISKKELQKKALMQQLLTGKKRLKGFNNECVKAKLSEYTKKVKGRVCEVSINKTGLPCITATSFNSNYTNFTNSTDAVYCSENDVLVLWDGENAGAVTTNHNGVIGSTVAKLVLKKGLNNFFITYLFHFENQRLRAIREGSGIPHMPGDFEDWFHFRLPLIEEQTAIANILQTADKEIQLLKAKADKLKQQKKGMMQVLLTGKKRLKVV